MTPYTDKEIAAVAWAANAELQALHGDPAPSLPGDTEDAEAHAVTVAGIRAILDGATPEQLHETWMRAREAQGWTYGPRKDSRLKTHPALIPYAELPEHQRVKDRVFTAIVRAMTGQDYGEHVARPLTATPGQALHEAAVQAAIGWQRAEDATPTAGDFDHTAEIMKLRGQLQAVRTLAENAAKSVHAEKVWLAQAVLEHLDSE